MSKPVENKAPIVINKTLEKESKPEVKPQKVPKQEEQKESKFMKRFMNRLPTNSGKFEDAGEYQWIHRPTGVIDLAHIQQLYVQFKNWIKNLKELLSRLSKMQDGMRGEIKYWNELANILDAAGREGKSVFVESTLQVLQEAYPKESKEFRHYREQIWNAMKEAKWNKKYLLSLKSVDVLYTGDWKEIAGVMKELMQSVRSIYEKSNFYKEVRVVNFLDHMYQHLLSQMKKEFKISKIMNGSNEIDRMNQVLDYGKIINTQFDEGFFLKQFMEDSRPGKHNFTKTMNNFGKGLKPVTSSMNSTQTSITNRMSVKNEKEKFKAHLANIEKFSSSTQQDFSQFMRPATSYGRQYEMSGSTGSAGMLSDDMTRPNSSWK